MGRKGIPLLVYLDSDLSTWLQKMHDEEGYPKSALVRLALRKSVRSGRRKRDDMTLEGEEEEKILAKLFEALPRLKQYHLTEAQRVFVEKLEEMKRKVEEQTSQIQLAKN